MAFLEIILRSLCVNPNMYIAVRHESTDTELVATNGNRPPFPNAEWQSTGAMVAIIVVVVILNRTEPVNSLIEKPIKRLVIHTLNACAIHSIHI